MGVNQPHATAALCHCVTPMRAAYPGCRVALCEEMQVRVSERIRAAHEGSKEGESRFKEERHGDDNGEKAGASIDGERHDGRRIQALVAAGNEAASTQED